MEDKVTVSTQRLDQTVERAAEVFCPPKVIDPVPCWGNRGLELDLLPEGPPEECLDCWIRFVLAD